MQDVPPAAATRHQDTVRPGTVAIPHATMAQLLAIDGVFEAPAPAAEREERRRRVCRHLVQSHQGSNQFMQRVTCGQCQKVLFQMYPMEVHASLLHAHLRACRAILDKEQIFGFSIAGHEQAPDFCTTLREIMRLQGLVEAQKVVVSAEREAARNLEIELKDMRVTVNQLEAANHWLTFHKGALEEELRAERGAAAGAEGEME